MFVQTLRLKHLLVTLLLSTSAASWGLEFGVDGGLAGNSKSDNWGLGFHGQMIGSTGFGLDIGYEYINSLSYSIDGSTLTHSMNQYEFSGLWQGGLRAVRLQLLSGVILSGTGVESNGQDIIQPLSAGYQIGAGLSVPIATRFRAFGEVGYEGWFNSDIPSHMTWRYGVRVLLGENVVQPLESEEMARERAMLEQQQSQLTNPPVTIDPAVPKYVPSGLSQSLPPIVSQAEICKCFPAGPYTLQLGEFGNMAQAIRALEYRGLRQFFNSFSYQRAPQPVFLAQSNPDGPVALYLGEIPSLEEMDYWRFELRKSGISARLKRIVGNNGERVANTIVDVPETDIKAQPKYTAEEIRRMNSLPEDEMAMGAIDGTMSAQQLADIEAYNASQSAQQQQMNAAPEVVSLVDATLQMGPISMTNLQSLLTMDAMKNVLARDSSISIPNDMTLVWDEGKREAWLSFSGFTSEQHVDEWQAWYGSEGIVAERVNEAYMPLGDTYEFHLGGRLQDYSLEIHRHAGIEMMLESMRSPEVLWFQAFQRINEEPVSVTLNWSHADSRYHLIVTNVSSAEEQQRIWANLTAVGLLPSLAEQ